MNKKNISYALLLRNFLEYMLEQNEVVQERGKHTIQEKGDRKQERKKENTWDNTGESLG